MPSEPSEEWNPKRLAFLAERGLYTWEADALDRPERIKLNAEFMCWNMANVSPERKKWFSGGR